LKAQTSSHSKLLLTNHCRRSLPAMNRSLSGLHALFSHVLGYTCLFVIITASDRVKKRKLKRKCVKL